MVVVVVLWTGGSIGDKGASELEAVVGPFDNFWVAEKSRQIKKPQGVKVPYPDSRAKGFLP